MEEKKTRQNKWTKRTLKANHISQLKIGSHEEDSLSKLIDCWWRSRGLFKWFRNWKYFFKNQRRIKLKIKKKKR